MFVLFVSILTDQLFAGDDYLFFSKEQVHAQTYLQATLSGASSKEIEFLVADRRNLVVFLSYPEPTTNTEFRVHTDILYDTMVCFFKDENKKRIYSIEAVPKKLQTRNKKDATAAWVLLGTSIAVATIFLMHKKRSVNRTVCFLLLFVATTSYLPKYFEIAVVINVAKKDVAFYKDIKFKVNGLNFTPFCLKEKVEDENCLYFNEYSID